MASKEKKNSEPVVETEAPAAEGAQNPTPQGDGAEAGQPPTGGPVEELANPEPDSAPDPEADATAQDGGVENTEKLGAEDLKVDQSQVEQVPDAEDDMLEEEEDTDGSSAVQSGTEG